MLIYADKAASEGIVSERAAGGRITVITCYAYSDRGSPDCYLLSLTSLPGSSSEIRFLLAVTKNLTVPPSMGDLAII